MRERLYPKRDYPIGHPFLSNAHWDLGLVYELWGRNDDALGQFVQSAEIEHSIAASFFSDASDSILLNLAAQRFRSLNNVLEVWRHTDCPVDEVYEYVWSRRGFVPRVISERMRCMRSMMADGVNSDFYEYMRNRRKLSHALIVSGIRDEPALSIAQLGPFGISRRVGLLPERRIANNLERAEGMWMSHVDSWKQLAEALPSATSFVDLVAYSCVRRPAQSVAAHAPEAARVLGFVISHGRKIACVDLGDADRIEGLVLRWRDEILAGRDDGTGQELRELVWDPISELFPEGTRTVYVAPDGALSLVAWGALPTGDTGHLLLEDYAIATVPHGQFLAEQLRRESPRRNPAAQQILAVGDVHYGVRTNDALVRQLGIKQMQWQPLQASADEVAAVSAAAADRHCMVLTGAAATPSAVLERLPHSRWAHFATHGFFVDPLLEKKLNLTTEMPAEEKLSVHRSRHTVLARSPFIRSGLALAGANELGELDELGVPKCTKGILTAEEIAASDCSSMELVVLSACETGRGDMAHGDGVFSIQTAFHVAGARNVIGTLWKIDDRATAQLMGTFYRLLWEDGRTPLDALRTAQLQAIHAARKQPMDLRGPDLSGTVSLTAGTARRAPTAANNIRTWAAFVLSGPGF